MSEVIINNKYTGYCESMEEVAYSQEIEKADHPELNEIFKDLAQHCGKYRYEYNYSGKEIEITNGCHTPIGEHPKAIDSKWLDYDISKMGNFSYKNKIRNCISYGL